MSNGASYTGELRVGSFPSNVYRMTAPVEALDN
jgi:hypothetical protein